MHKYDFLVRALWDIVVCTLATNVITQPMSKLSSPSATIQLGYDGRLRGPYTGLVVELLLIGLWAYNWVTNVL